LRDGQTSINAQRDATKPAVILQVKDGKFKYIETVKAAPSARVNWFLQQSINGLALGSIYALIALGYTMVYGVLRFINFAHSDVMMLGAFAAYFLAPPMAKIFPAQSYSGALCHHGVGGASFARSSAC
jgi:ABC-type branched-subunit amino acid transport system permease subunit